MRHERVLVHKAPVEARTIAPRAIARAPTTSSVQQIQRRLGNEGLQRWVAQAQRAAAISSPGDASELEAQAVARQIVRTPDPGAVPTHVATPASPLVQRSPATGGAAAAATPLPAGVGPGTALPASVRSYMEPRFGADFGNVRLHTGEPAAQLSENLGAQAFTVGEHVFFGRNQFQPESDGGRELIAHELTHTIQQRAVVQRSAAPDVAVQAAPQAQRFGLSDALSGIANRANAIPGFRLLTLVLGVNPINMAPVERSASNLLRALLELVPVAGPLLVQALDSHGIFAKVGAWAEARVRTLGMAGATLKAALDRFLDSLSWSDVLDLSGVWERAKRIFTEPIDRLIAFGAALVGEIAGFVREAILLPLAKLAEGTRGYDLLKAVLGQDPITGTAVPRNADTLIGGFMKLIGQEEVWENLKKANAVARAWAWFQGALAGVLAFVRQVPTLFVAALRSLEVADLILVPRAFAKVASVFGGFVLEFIKWAGSTVLRLLEIIFEVVSPATLVYLKKTGTALLGILKNPLPFVRNLVNAAKLGFQNFAGNFTTHLKAGLIGWLTGALPGVYIPKAFTLGEIVKFAFSVLGLTWQNIRGKLVKVIGETAVKAMETGFDIVVTLVTQGPAAAWEKIQEQLANLKDMVIGGITDFVVDTVVKKAVPKLIAMFIPGAGFISAIISIYDTIMVFVQKLAKIVEVAKAFVDSIVAIAGGAIDAAAKKVESVLAGLLSLAISFLAGFIGLGNVADKVMGVIQKIRATIDKAIDALIAWIVKMAKAFVGKVKTAAGKVLGWAFASSTFKDADGHAHTISVSESDVLTIASTPRAAYDFVKWYAAEKKIDPKAVTPIYTLVDAAEKVVNRIKKSKKTVDDIPSPDQQAELLKLSLQISDLIGKLVSGDRKLGKLSQKYLLEGQVGTYATVPKPVGDQLTPDHQPQASVILAAADFFRLGLKITSGDLADRAKSRAAQGYAINLHFRRHVAGATYGSKGKTREGFYAELVSKAGSLDKGPAKAKVVEMLRAELMKDVARMKSVVGFDLKSDAWSQLRDEAVAEAKQSNIDQKAAEAEALETKKAIGERIVSGENQIASQPLDF